MDDELTNNETLDGCPDCDPTSLAFKYPLEESEHFFIVCDSHSVVPGHILIIPKSHRSAIGEYSDDELVDLKVQYKKVMNFIEHEYGFASAFEHGKFGQSAKHSHIHCLPFKGLVSDIVHEGENYIEEIDGLEDIKSIYQRDGGYMLFELGGRRYIVDKSLQKPQFFRERFAAATGRPNRSNWRELTANYVEMQEIEEQNLETQKKWGL